MICEADKGKMSIICLKSTIERKRNETLASAVADGTYTKIEPRDGEDTDQQLMRIHNDAEREYKIVAQKLRRHIVGGITECTEGDMMRSADQSRRTPDGRRYERRAYNGKVELLGDKLLCKTQPKRIRNEAYGLARMYISIKVHKGEEYPVRPIIAAPAVMGSTAEEWMREMLTTLVTTDAIEHNGVDEEYISKFKFIANNTIGVIQDIQRNGLKPGHSIISFDIVSMYTNINTASAMRIIQEQYLTISKHTTVPMCVFIQALECLMKHNLLFTANNAIYKQTKGLPMGGKLSKILSEIVTANGTAAAIKKAISEGYDFSFIHKYVDDYIIGVNIDNESRTVEKLQGIFEANLKGMKLTHELEKWSDDMAEIKFLDFTIMRQSNVRGINTIWSRPKYASERMVSAYADAPYSSKVNTINKIINKAINYSTGEMKHLALHRAQSWVCGNGYTPKTFNAILRNNAANKAMLAAEDREKAMTATTNNIQEQQQSETNAEGHASQTTTGGIRHKAQRRHKCATCQNVFRTRTQIIGQNAFICKKCDNSTAQQPTDKGIGTAQQADEQQKTNTNERAVDINENASNEAAIAAYERHNRSERGLDAAAAKRVRMNNGSMRPVQAVTETAAVAMSDCTPLYIQIPHVKGLDKALNEILRSWDIPTRFAGAKSDNGIFRNVEDKIHHKYSSMVTFSIWCSTCGEHQILNEIDTTIQNRIENHKRHHDATHNLRWQEPHVIATHATVARAYLGHALIKTMKGKEQLHDDIMLKQIQQLLDAPHRINR